MFRVTAQAALETIRIKRDPIGYARSIGVEVGDDCRFLGLTRGTFGSEPYLVSIGNHVTVTGGVNFITHEGGAWVFREEFPDLDVFAPIRVHDNTFIGLGAMLLPGVEVGPNAIVAAGAVVTKDVPPDTVVGGVPAKHICKVDDFRDRLLGQAVHVRSLPEAQKREAVLRHLNGSRHGDDDHDAGAAVATGTGARPGQR